MDNLNIYHVDPNLVDNIIDMLNEKYLKEAPLTVTQGKVHKYLVMTIFVQQQERWSSK